jgi:hypothetical protein
VDIESVKRALPEGAYIHGAKFNEEDSCVELHWEHDKFVSRNDFESEFPLQNLEMQKLPKGIEMFKERKPAPRVVDQSEPEPERVPADVKVEQLDAEARALVKAGGPITEAQEQGEAAPVEEEQPEGEDQPSSEKSAEQSEPAAAAEKAVAEGEVPTSQPKAAEKKKSRR